MDFRILGPLEALDEGRDVALAGSKRRALLALLLVHANETVSIERLIDELWGESPPATAARTVQAHVSRLRKALAAGNDADGLIVTRERGYQLRLDPERLDALRFERLLTEGRSELAAGHPARAATAFDAALSLWRGAPLAGLENEPFVRREVARLEDLRLAALEDLGEAELALGHHGDLVGRLEALIGEHPYRERLRAQLMLALYRGERQADALQAYQDARRTLVEELGIEPGERLRELERAILAQDPALAALPATGDGGEVASGPADLPTGVVTFLLTDIEGSSGLWEADPAAMADALELHDRVIAERVQACRGRLLKSKGEGDAALAVFRRASNAVACAAELQGALLSTSWPGGLDLRVRVALHTGEALERAGRLLRAGAEPGGEAEGARARRRDGDVADDGGDRQGSVARRGRAGRARSPGAAWALAPRARVRAAPGRWDGLGVRVGRRRDAHDGRRRCRAARVDDWAAACASDTYPRSGGGLFGGCAPAAARGDPDGDARRARWRGEDAARA